MNKIYIIFATLIILVLMGCKNESIDIPSHYFAKVLLSVDESIDFRKPLRLYINQEDMNRTLNLNTPNVIYLQGSRVNIQVVQKYKTADISFTPQKSNTYDFRLLKTVDNDLIIVQTK